MLLNLTPGTRRRITVILGSLALAVTGTSLASGLHFLSDNRQVSRVLRSIDHLSIDDHFEHLMFFFALCLLFALCLRPARSGQELRFYWRTLFLLLAGVFFVKVLNVNRRELVVFTIFEVLGSPVSFIVILAVAFILSLTFGWYLLKFLHALQPRIRNAFLIGGMLYLPGANGMWRLHGWVVGQHGIESIRHVLVDLGQNVLEMGGLLVFINGLLLHLTETRDNTMNGE